MNQTNQNDMLNIMAPLNGFIIPLEKVPDEVFAKKMVGDGLAIEPINNILTAPVAGTVSMVHSAGHAVTLKTPEGVEVLMHIGLETVGLAGEGFEVLVKKDQRVNIGDKLIQFDMDLLAQKAKSLITPVLILNANEELQNKQSEIVYAKSDLLFNLPVTQMPSSTESSEQSENLKSKEYHIQNKTGIHARPSAVIASEAKNFSCELHIYKGNQSANAKSIVGIMGLEVKQNDTIFFEASGGDAQACLKAIDKVMTLGFDDHEEVAPAKVETVKLAKEDENTLAGIPASPGLSVGKIFQISSEDIEVEDKDSEPTVEKANFEKALTQAKTDLNNLKDSMIADGNAGRAAIFNAHLELIDDPDLIDETMNHIGQRKSAAFAWKSAYVAHAKRLSELTNELFAARAADLQDVGNRVLRILVGDTKRSKVNFPDEAILIAESLTPSDTASLDKNKVLGFATTTGGATSHVAILARSLGIPAITGINTKVFELENGTPVVLDGDLGTLKKNVSENELAQIRERQKTLQKNHEEALAKTFEPALTTDHIHIEVAANIAGVNDAKDSMKYGCDGVGLLRSEFLFLERSSAPTENDQLLTYQSIADALKGEGEPKKFIVRTLDVGGDKPLSYMPIPKEENPFLGERGIRVSLNNLDVFREQIRAILRVNPLTQVRIMFPMVSNLKELLQAKQVVKEEQKKLGLEDVKVEIGIMVEVPSTAIMAEQFAEYVDFFSVGANDLTQYTLAIDRGHNKLAKQADGLDPAVLRLIKMTCEGAKKWDKWVGVCGGIASELPAVPLLIGLGVRELSVSIPVLPTVKAEVRKYSLADCVNLADKAIGQESATHVRELVANYKK